jgi:hypothetical protein
MPELRQGQEQKGSKPMMGTPARPAKGMVKYFGSGFYSNIR